MECPHFAGVFMKYCVAERETYVPSVYEMREYCQQAQHRVCRIYMRTDKGTAMVRRNPVQRHSVPRRETHGKERQEA